MKPLGTILGELRLWRETRAQDMIEYALMAGFVAVAAGALLPNAGGTVSAIFSKVTSALSVAILTNQSS